MRTSQLIIRSGLVTRARTSIAALTLAAFGAACLPVEAAQAAPQWCRAWKVGGQTWYGYQSNGYSLLFTVRMAGSTSSLSGYARASRGDVNRGGVSSQYLRGGVVSDGIGRVMIEVQWANGSRGQYHATTYDVRRSASGGLTRVPQLGGTRSRFRGVIWLSRAKSFSARLEKRGHTVCVVRPHRVCGLW